MPSTAKSFHESARARVYQTTDAVHLRPSKPVRLHGDRPNNGNAGRLRITSRRVKL